MSRCTNFTGNMSIQQVAHLWQRDRANLALFSINVQRYSQNHAQNCILGSPYGGIRGNVFQQKIFTQRNFVAEFIERISVSFVKRSVFGIYT